MIPWFHSIMLKINSACPVFPHPLAASHDLLCNLGTAFSPNRPVRRRRRGFLLSFSREILPVRSCAGSLGLGRLLRSACSGSCRTLGPGVAPPFARLVAPVVVMMLSLFCIVAFGRPREWSTWATCRSFHNNMHPIMCSRGLPVIGQASRALLFGSVAELAETAPTQHHQNTPRQVGTEKKMALSQVWRCHSRVALHLARISNRDVVQYDRKLFSPTRVFQQQSE